MIDWLDKNFSPGTNYLVCQTHAEQINQLLSDHLIVPFQQGRKHILWGQVAERLPLVGTRLGWVPNKLGLSFLNESVELELADAYACRENIFQVEERHYRQADELLHRFKLIDLKDQNPFSLSEGETKLLWFLTQWIKQPEFLVVGYLPTSLSQQRITFIVDFFIQTLDARIQHPIIVLGYHSSQTDWFEPLLGRKDWILLNRVPDYE